MKMEAVQSELHQWGEIMITTSAGESYELHIGDTEFDTNARVIKLKTPDASYIINGDGVETVKKHYGHPVH